MSNQNMTYQDLLRIVELIKSASHFGEFHLKTGDLEIDLRRGTSGVSHAPMPVPSSIPTAAPENQVPERHESVAKGEPSIEPPAKTQAPAPVFPGDPVPDYPSGAVLIKSPMVGTFYRAPEPGAAPFCEVGRRVDASETVCLIEVMKLINSIPAGQKGTVTHILVEDGEPVEFGQVLMVIDPEQ